MKTCTSHSIWRLGWNMNKPHSLKTWTKHAQVTEFDRAINTQTYCSGFPDRLVSSVADDSDTLTWIIGTKLCAVLGIIGTTLCSVLGMETTLRQRASHHVS